MEILIYHPVLRAPDAVLDEAPRLEALGFDGMVMPDHLYVLDFQSGVPLPYPHPLPVLSAAAAVTRRLKLLALVSNNLARGPVELAQQTATLANLAPGRVELGHRRGLVRGRARRRRRGVSPGSGSGPSAGRIRVRSAAASSPTAGRPRRGALPGPIPIGGFTPVEGAIPIMVGAAAPAMIRAAAQVADRVDLQPDALTGGGADLRQYNSYTFELLGVRGRPGAAGRGGCGPGHPGERITLRAHHRRRDRRRQGTPGDGRLPGLGRLDRRGELRHPHRIAGRGRRPSSTGTSRRAATGSTCRR